MMSKIIQKQNDSTKYNRINQIYEMLKNNIHGFTIAELANELDVSTKTIQRDLYEVLSDLGAIKEGWTWKIDPKLASDDLNTKERLILGILDEMAKSAGNVFYSKAHSLLSQITQQLEHPIFTNVNGEYLEDKTVALFEQIEIAIKEKNEIKFDYEKYNFHVKPLKLAFFDGFWYLLALHVKKNKEEFKKYHLKTIKKVEVLSTKFEIPALVEDRLKFANSVWFNLDEQYSVRLFIDKQIRKYFERKPLRGQSIIGEDRDGSIEREIKVLEPQHLADEIKDRVQGYLKEIK